MVGTITVVAGSVSRLAQAVNRESANEGGRLSRLAAANGEVGCRYCCEDGCC
jgi:hypothetical protein